MVNNIDKACHVWNLYGPAETTIDCTYHRIDYEDRQKSVPIGRLLPGYRCVILDAFSKFVCANQEGELVVGGNGVFAGYLGREDLTASALVDIDGERFYRTGDLVRYDDYGQLHYVGRKDHQIKLHGQRIELGEIERCLLDCSPRITGCVVTKHGDHHLVAYVQSDDIGEKEMREYCRSHLPPFMVPSLFTVLQQLPLNVNGKIDRTLLPTPNFSTSSSNSYLNDNDEECARPSNEIEERIHSLWCEVLQCSQISTNHNIFTLGGHSLILIQIYHRYKTMYNFDTRAVPISQLFQSPTISDHARFIAEAAHAMQDNQERWCRLEMTQGNPFPDIGSRENLLLNYLLTCS